MPGKLKQLYVFLLILDKKYISNAYREVIVLFWSAFSKVDFFFKQYYRNECGILQRAFGKFWIIGYTFCSVLY